MDTGQEIPNNLEKSGTFTGQLDCSLNLNDFELSLMRQIISSGDIGTALQHHQSKSPEDSANFPALQNPHFTAGQCNEVVSGGNDHRPPPLANKALPERKYIGVSRRQSGKFSAEITIRTPEKKRKRMWLGTYDKEEEAAMAFDRAAFKVRGSLAVLNFPDLIGNHNFLPEKDANKELLPWTEGSPLSPSPELLINPQYQEPQTEPEIEPGSKPDGSRKRVRRSQKNPNGQAAPKKWTPAEEAALATAYIDTMDEFVKCNAQNSGFCNWNRVEETFYKVMSVEKPYRSKHQIHAKWRNLNPMLLKFNGIYNNLVANEKSDKSDDIIFMRALEEYSMTSNGLAFSHTEAWNIVRISPRWESVNLPETSSSKQSKSLDSNDQTESSDPPYFLDLNDNDDVIEEPQRPIGRDGARKVDSSTKKLALTGDMVQELVGSINNFATIFDQHLQFKKQMHLERKEEREKDRELKILELNKDSEEAQAAIRAMQMEIAKKYRNSEV